MSSKRKQVEAIMLEEITYTTLMSFEDKLSQLTVKLILAATAEGNDSYNIFATTKEATELHLAGYDNYQEAVIKFGESVQEFTKQCLNGSITNLGLPS